MKLEKKAKGKKVKGKSANALRDMRQAKDLTQKGPTLTPQQPTDRTAANRRGKRDRKAR
jgi:hypothetical protein